VPGAGVGIVPLSRRPYATSLRGMTNSTAVTATSALPSAPDLDLDLHRTAVDILCRSLSQPALLPGHPDLDAEVSAFNLATTHRPAIVVPATCSDDVVAAVRFGASTGLAVAVQATGHGAVQAADGAVLVTTSRMQDLSVDPVARTARVGAGVRWARVIEAAAPYGLAPLSGSSSDVGVVGYTLGGGLGPLGRRYGFAADHVRSIDLVTADGRLRTVTADEGPELFWALRGGKGNFGIVTSIEVGLVPVGTLYGGGMFWSGDDAPAVLHAWRSWVSTLPEETTSSIALLRLPDLPHVPEPLRGRLSVHLRVAHCGDVATGRRLVAVMRAVAAPLVDLVREMPFTEVDSIHMDPTDPLPVWESGRLLSELPAEAVDAVLAAAGPGVDVPLIMAELRHLGGALARPAAPPNAVSGRCAAFSAFVLGPAVPGLEDAVPAVGEGLLAALAPYDAGVRLVNFLGHATDPAQVSVAWSPQDAARLIALKAQLDPQGLFSVGHCLPTASPIPAQRTAR
jgi:FAD/FMN-containing dehydrogenase